MKDCRFGDEGCKTLNEILKKSKIEKIELVGNEITDIGIKRMKDSLQMSETIKELILYSNEITDEGCKTLNEILKKSKIETMDLECKFNYL
jgi:Ran GTPase-activating protein (RanGAP) involved in mRNA processing and transport